MKRSKKKPKATTTRTFGVERISLAKETCSPSQPGQQSLGHQDILILLGELNPQWELREPLAIHRTYAFANFAEALHFVNRAGEICETENHHAEFALGWGFASAKIWTHDVGGLTRSDFILAAKFDQI